MGSHRDMGAGAGTDAEGLWGAHGSLKPQGPIPHLLNFPQPFLPTPISPSQASSPVGSFTLQLLQTSTFQNTSFVETEGVGLLEDIELASLDKHTWTIRFHQPWVHPALPHSHWHTIENMIKIYLRRFNHLVNEGAVQKGVPCEYPLSSEERLGRRCHP